MGRIGIKRTLLIGAVLGSNAHAATFAGLRPLQMGAIGEGPAFAEFEASEVEAQVTIDSGTGTASAPATQLTSSSRRKSLDIGYGARLTESFVFSGYARFGTRSFDEESSGASTFEQSVSQDFVELTAGPTLRVGPLALGGAVSIETIGEESRSLKGSANSGSWAIDSVTIPTFRVFAVREMRAGLLLGLGLKVYNQASTDASIRRDDGSSLNTKLTRKLPGEIRMDVKNQISDAIDLGLSLTWLGTGHASPAVDEMSLATQVDSSGLTRLQQNTSRLNRDHMQLAFGGRYSVDRRIGFLGSLQYVSPAYAEEDHASLESENLGGARIDIGTESAWMGGKVHFHAGYAMPRKVRLKREESSTPRLGSIDDSVSLEQARWLLTVGGSLRL